MKIILTTEAELKDLIKTSTREILEEILLDIIRKATRKEWLATDDVMDYLKCSRRHVQHLRDSNRLPFSQNGRTIRYYINDVLEYLNRGRVGRTL
ncbi:MAG: helix-turn-helix domain-containing protein [Candidatus Paceibacterota bacterium]